MPFCTIDVRRVETFEPSNELAAFVPRFESLLFCSSLRMEISRLDNIHPPATSMCGRYLVRADFRTFIAACCLARAMPNCLLLRRAIARQESSDSVCASIGNARHSAEAHNDRKKNFFIRPNQAFHEGRTFFIVFIPIYLGKAICYLNTYIITFLIGKV